MAPVMSRDAAPMWMQHVFQWKVRMVCRLLGIKTSREQRFQAIAMHELRYEMVVRCEEILQRLLQAVWAYMCASMCQIACWSDLLGSSRFGFCRGRFVRAHTFSWALETSISQKLLWNMNLSKDGFGTQGWAGWCIRCRTRHHQVHVAPRPAFVIAVRRRSMSTSTKAQGQQTPAHCHF